MLHAACASKCGYNPKVGVREYRKRKEKEKGGKKERTEPNDDPSDTMRPTSAYGLGLAWGASFLWEDHSSRSAWWSAITHRRLP